MKGLSTGWVSVGNELAELAELGRELGLLETITLDKEELDRTEELAGTEELDGTEELEGSELNGRELELRCGQSG